MRDTFTLDKVHAYYKFKTERVDGAGNQASYNVPRKFYNYLIENDLVEQRDTFKNRINDTVKYNHYLRDGINFKLGEGIVSIIGRQYAARENKFFVSENIKEKIKPQMYKAAYNQKGTEYEWFCELYAKNCIGNEMVLNYDESKKELTMDAIINYSSEINNQVDNNDEDWEDYEVEGREIKDKNIILFGVPGCGKSYTIKTEYCDDNKYMERVVFHPDYSYADFVGQILPSNESGHIEYPFKPGPFTRMLAKANKDRENNYYLIIEEINRGNAPAIFGDIFQLLDRDDEGTSIYPINNTDIAKEVYDGDANHEVRIPSNLLLLATMNTADQNVFTLDTAFKRRWKFKCIENNINGCDFAEKQILDTKVTWKEFVEKINKEIISQARTSIGSEDKRLGAWFIKEDDLSDKENFGSKILMYLWNDVFKYNPEEIFNISLLEEQTLDCLIRKFNEIEFSIFNEKIKFNQTTVDQSKYSNVDTDLLSSYNDTVTNIYNEITSQMKDKVTSFDDKYLKKSNYFQFQANDISRAGFADIKMCKNKKLIYINVEKPQEELATKLIESELGSETTDNSWSHHFLITLQDETDLTSDVIEAIYNSYKALKISE